MRALFLSLLGIALLSSGDISAQRLSRKDFVQKIEQLTKKMDSFEKQVNERDPLTKPVGTLYYDTRTDKIGCYTTQGWRYLKFE